MSKNNIFYYNKNFESKTDEEIALLAKAGEESALEYLLEKYKDIIQEGMIGLYKAIKCFDNEKQNSFKSFANLCIERQLITAIKTSTRQKHMALNSYLSLNMSAYDDDEDTSLMDVFNSNTVEDPLDTIKKKE